MPAKSARSAAKKTKKEPTTIEEFFKRASFLRRFSKSKGEHRSCPVLSSTAAIEKKKTDEETLIYFVSLNNARRNSGLNL